MAEDDTDSNIQKRTTVGFLIPLVERKSIGMEREPMLANAMPKAICCCVLMSGLSGCEPLDDSCGDLDTSRYERDVITISGIERISGLVINQSGSLEALDEHTPVDIVDLALQVDLQYVSRVRVPASVKFSILDWLIGPAHACSPPLYHGDIISKVVEMDLVSNASLGVSFGPGVSLASEFEAEGIEIDGIDYGDFGISQNQPLESYSTSDFQSASVRYILRPFFSAEEPALASEANMLHRSTFTIALATGEMFVMDSEAINISSKSMEN